ncbi:unnamed protein product [Cuscuta campestris]|uniref:Protein-tyrosine-phosphatase n=1 Tax=Cuscuta campestris TaxID=132261 RepID=A0A484NDB8_9ASTE|nr:unnamed protein product [Cuscuta campestris]
MLGKEDTSCTGGDGASGSGGLRGPCQLPSGRRMYWRSASWSSSRSSLPPLNPEGEKDSLDPNAQSRRPLTPRSQQSFKGRSCLPPLAIARRSLDEWPRAGSDDIGEWPLPSTPSARDSINNSERLKLDLSNIQKNPERNGGLVKREKIAFFDKECSKVAAHIYLGGDAVAKDRELLKQNGITHILNCVGFVCPEYFKSDFAYRTLWLQDSPSEDITSILYDVFDYFEDVREQDGRIFVHCCQGVSRSTSLVIAYLMWREGQSFDDAFQYVKAARGIADPNMGFACQLLQCQKRVHAFPLSPSSLLRMYRIAPHSPYDPLHLVPKMLNDPTPSALDSRGAFIIHIPSAIYAWIGKKCEAIMERDARSAVCQIARYEKVQGPIGLISEGEEPSYFWDAFSNFLPLMDKSNKGVDVVGSSIKICPGQRMVDTYDIDFEIFQKAILGGFAPPFASSEAEHETHLPVRESSWSVLRRKFVSGNMKDFISASNQGLSRVYPDSTRAVLDNSASKQLCSPLLSLSSNSSLSPSSVSLSSSSSSLCASSSLSLSSFSSPPYLSPDSFSSDSSCNSSRCSDSPLVSPSFVSCADLTSSALSGFSDMSLHPPKLSPKSISKTSKYIDVNFTLRSSQSTSLHSRKFPVSIAERRGSQSKCLKLPMLTDDDALGNDGMGVTYGSSLGSESLRMEDILEPHRGANASKETDSLRISHIVINNDSLLSDVISSTIRESHVSGENDVLFFNGLVDGHPSKLMQPIIFKWPNLENIAHLSAADDLDSDSVYIFVSSRPQFNNVQCRILYFWVGSSFSCKSSNVCSGNCQSLCSSKEIHWGKITSDALQHMGLPLNTDIKIVKENEEPEEFLDLLNYYK